MKSLIVIVCLVLVAAAVHGEDASEAYMEHLKETIEECAKELSVPEDVVKNIRESGGDVQQMGCFKACILKKHDLMKDGKLQLDKINAFVEMVGKPDNVEKYKGRVDTCFEQVKDVTDECEIGMKFVDCCMEAAKDK